MLRLDPQNLSPADALKCDLISTLRLSIDSAQADALEGRAADLGRLIVATESLVKLLPSETPKPDSRDSHEAMIAPLRKLYRYLHEQVHTLTAENAALRAQLGLPVSGGGAGVNCSTAEQSKPAIDLPLSAITPPSEIGHAIVGKVAGPDDPPKRPPVVIDGKANPPVAPAASAAPPPRPAWEDWLDAGAGVGPGYDRWADNR